MGGGELRNNLKLEVCQNIFLVDLKELTEIVKAGDKFKKYQNRVVGFV